MTNARTTLDLIRPDNGRVGDDMPSGDVEAVQVQEEIGDTEGIEDADESRAEAEEEVRRPKLAARPYTPTRAGTESGVDIVCIGEE